LTIGQWSQVFFTKNKDNLLVQLIQSMILDFRSYWPDLKKKPQQIIGTFAMKNQLSLLT
jgi:hypothetical protein